MAEPKTIELEKLAFVMKVLRNMDLPKADYKAIAAEEGIKNAENARKIFRRIIQEAGFDLDGDQVVGSEDVGPKTRVAVTPSPKKRKAPVDKARLELWSVRRLIARARVRRRSLASRSPLTKGSWMRPWMKEPSSGDVDAMKMRQEANRSAESENADMLSLWRCSVLGNSEDSVKGDDKTSEQSKC